MARPQKDPYVSDATDPSSGRPATFIFLHGYGDDAEGLPLGMAQQFQFNKKLPHLKWLLPNAPHNRDAQGQAWYMIKALPNSLKPAVPGHDDDVDPANADDDEESIMTAVDYVDSIVKLEIESGTEGRRIVVGGFSQGCAVSLVWGLCGRYRDVVGGMVCCSGYFPLADKIQRLREERPAEVASGADEGGGKKWLYVHGSKDMLVSSTLFAQGKEELGKYIDGGRVEEHLYEGMGHSTCNAELRDLLAWLERVVPP